MKRALLAMTTSLVMLSPWGAGHPQETKSTDQNQIRVVAVDDLTDQPRRDAEVAAALWGPGGRNLGTVPFSDHGDGSYSLSDADVRSITDLPLESLNADILVVTPDGKSTILTRPVSTLVSSQSSTTLAAGDSPLVLTVGSPAKSEPRALEILAGDPQEDEDPIPSDGAVEGAPGAMAVGTCPEKDGPGRVDVVRDFGLRKFMVGTLDNYTPNKPAKLTLSAGRDITTGVGVSAEKYAGFSQSGAESVCSGVSIAFAPLKTTGHKYVRSYAHMIQSCEYWAGTVPHYYYRVHAKSIAGGAAISDYSGPGISTAYCTPVPSGGHVMEMTRSHSTTWTNGLSLKYYIGIDLSSQTGYSMSAKHTTTFLTAGRWCGVRGYPSETPGRIFSLAPAA